MATSYFQPESYIRLSEMIILTLLFGITGYLFLLVFFDHSTVPNPFLSLGMAIPAGLIVIILMVLGLSFIDIPLSKPNLSFTFLGFYVLSAYWIFIKKKAKLYKYFYDWTQGRLVETIFPIIIFLIILVLRGAQISDTFVPNWYDGLIHTSLLNKFITNFKIPPDNIYHVGFHAIALVVYHFGGLSLHETVLILGTWLSATCGLTFYYFTLRFTRNTYASGICFAAYSSFLIFPSYLNSWSRYPFLLGLTLLPYVTLTSMNWITNHKGNYVLAIVSIVALTLTHYGSLLIWFSFVLSYAFTGPISKKKGRINLFRFRYDLFLRSILLIVPLLFILLPKTINLINHPAILTNMMARVQEPGFDLDTQVLWEKFRAKNNFLLFLWITGGGWAWIRRKRLLSVIWLWPFMVCFFTWAQYQILGLSISNYVNLIIFLAVPLAFTLGFLLVEILLHLRYVNSFWPPSPMRNLTKGILSILFIGISVGTYSVPQGIDKEKALLTSDDRFAMNWIENNTPQDSGFIVRTIIWGNSQLIPYDGGAWINFLTGRRIIIPQIGELYDLCGFAKQKRADYLYFGSKPLIETFDLRMDSFAPESYSVAYQNQTVKIYEISCAQN